eukprot:UN04148
MITADNCKWNEDTETCSSSTRLRRLLGYITYTGDCPEPTYDSGEPIVERWWFWFTCCMVILVGTWTGMSYLKYGCVIKRGEKFYIGAKKEELIKNSKTERHMTHHYNQDLADPENHSITEGTTLRAYKEINR